MSYTKQSWADGPEGGTPASAERLGHIEDGIAAAHDAADTAQTVAVAAGDAAAAASSGLAAKADVSALAAKADVSALDNKSDVGHTHTPASIGAAAAVHAHTAADVSDSTPTGRAVLTAADAGAARAAIGAGTSSLAIGTTASTAKAGNYQPVAANISDLTEAVQDIVGAQITAGANITAAYDDATGKIIVAASGGGGTALAWLNVRDYGATGNGTTDDAAAIQSALTAIPAGGGVVYFPPGTYLVKSGTGLVPKENTIMLGTHSPRYAQDASAAGASNCKIILGSGFTGTGLIKPAGTTRGLGFRGLCLAGAGIGSGVHGFDSPLAQETGWVLENMQVVGFTGDGWHGSQHVVAMRNCHFSHNTGWGINVDGVHKVTDVKWDTLFVYFNRAGGLNLDPTGYSGFLACANSRFERSGGNQANVQAPFTANAPGIRIRQIHKAQFTNCNTDANTGSGVDIQHTVAGRAPQVTSVQFTNCIFARDGYGLGTVLPDQGGVHLKGTGTGGGDVLNYVSFVNCTVEKGLADDGGAWPTYQHPARGLWMENTAWVQWIGGFLQGATSFIHYGTAGASSNYRPTLIDHEHTLNTVPQGSTGSRPTLGLMPGLVFYDATLSKPIWYSGSNWKDSAGTTV